MITFCIPSKNNLRYLKTCVQSIRQNSLYDTNKILVYVDQDDDGTVDWLKSNDVEYIVNNRSECRGIGHAYDTMFREASTDLVVAFHADMILGPQADHHLLKYHERGTVVCSTRIETPLHQTGPEKIVMDFGLWPEELKIEEFNSFVRMQTELNMTKTTGGMFAPWLIHRDDHLGHDPIFLSVFEDADLFRRFKLANYEMVQSWSSLVYHLTCRGGQFEHAKTNSDFQTRSTDWQNKNRISLLEYVRKWGGLFKEYGPCEPRPNIKHNVGAKIVNCPNHLLSVEPFFDQLCVDCDFSSYIEDQQPNSSFDLRSKFVSQLTTDIQLEIDASDVASVEQFQYIVNNIEEIIEQVEDSSSYEFGGVTINIASKKSVQPSHDLTNRTQPQQSTAS